MKFLDLVKVYIKSGNGGSGALSFRREKYIEKGGPDGGNGGRGGSVWGIPDVSLNTLIDFKYKQHHFAKNGKPGQGKKKTGESGDDIYLKLPLGTEILDEEQKVILGEINTTADKVLIIPGGNGGLGNHNFKSSTNRAPRKFTSGEKGLEKTIYLRLKLIADIGMLGLPNAGKSTFLSITSNAKPKIANYPFTTLIPNLGVVRKIDGNGCLFADIPGLISGAADGVGLGHDFLRHIQRTKILIHLIDAIAENPLHDFEIIEQELKKYGKGLLDKERIIVLNKMELVDDDYLKIITKKLEDLSKKKVLVISSSLKKGLSSLLSEVWKRI